MTGPFGRGTDTRSIALVLAVGLATLALAVGVTGAGVAGDVDATNETDDLKPEVEFDAVVEPGANATFTASSADADDITIEGDKAGWVVHDVDSTAPDLVTFPDPDELPVESDADETWGHLSGSPFGLTIEAPEEEGNYTFTAVAEGDDDTEATTDFTIEVAETAADLEVTDFPDQRTVEGNATDVRATVTNAGTDDANETVTLTIANATAEETVDAAPDESQSIRFENVDISDLDLGDHEMTLDTGDATATATLSVQEAHESGVPSGTADAIAGADDDAEDGDDDDAEDGDDITREDMRVAVERFLTGQPIGDIDLTRDEVRDLIEWFILTD